MIAGALKLEDIVYAENKVRPQWWYVFLTDLRVRTSRFRILGKFRFALPFTMVILFIIQFFAVLFGNTSTEFAIIINAFLADNMFKIETILASFIIFTAYNTSVSYFSQNTTMEELELISGSPISTKSYLFGKYLSMQINNIIFVPFIMIAHVEIAKLAGQTINWFYFFYLFVTLVVLFFSLSWLGLTLGPKAVFNVTKQQKGQRGVRDIKFILIGLFVVFQFFIPAGLSVVLSPELFEKVFTFIPSGWYAKVAKEMLYSNSIDLVPSLYGFAAICFGLIFLVFAYYRSRYSLNLENFEALSGEAVSNSKTPLVVKIMDKLPIPEKYSVKTFYLLSNRKSSINYLVDILFVVAAIGVTIVGLILTQYNWSNYVFIGGIIVGAMMLTMSSTEGLQLLFGGKNTFLVCQSAPKGIRKMLYGKVVQLLVSNLVEIFSISLVVLVFHNNIINALLLVVTIICGIFNGLMTGVVALAIAPFFETSDITSNPLRGLQIALPLNINLFLAGGVVIVMLVFFPTLPFWVIFLILSAMFTLLGIVYFFIAEKLLLRFQT